MHIHESPLMMSGHFGCQKLPEIYIDAINKQIRWLWLLRPHPVALWSVWGHCLTLSYCQHSLQGLGAAS